MRTKKKLKQMWLLFTIIFFSGVQFIAAQSIIESETYEDGSIDIGIEACDTKYTPCDCGVGKSIKIVTDPVDANNKVCQHKQIPCHKRAEVKGSRVPRDANRWYYYRTYLESFNGGNICQLHHYQKEVSMPGWYSRKGGPSMMRGGSDREMQWQITRSLDCEKNTNRTMKNVTTYPNQQWVEVAIHIKYSCNSDGFMYLWTNDGSGWVQRINHSGETYMHPDFVQGPYFKMGIYAPEGNNNTLYTDDYYMGEGYASLNDFLVDVGSEGSCSEVLAGGDSYCVKILETDDFSDSNWENRWVMETGVGGSATASVSNGQFHITSPVSSEGASVWYNTEMPANFFVKYKVRGDASWSDNRYNFNHFSHVRETDGGVLEYIRSGDYEEYHYSGNGSPAINGYIATFVDQHSRLRKEPDFQLLSEDLNAEAVGDKIYEIVYTCVDGRIRHYVDGVKIHDYFDNNALAGGKFGLRTWRTKAWWDDFEFGEIITNPKQAEIIEAEDMTLNNFEVSSDAGYNASGGEFIKITTEPASASYTFNLTPGIYNVGVGYIDEGDGAGTWRLKLNSTLLSEWTGTHNDGNGSTSNWQGKEQEINNITLAQNDELTIEATINDGEYGRTDYLSFVLLQKTCTPSPCSGLVPVENGISASAAEGDNISCNTMDCDLGTRWSAEGDGEWIQFDLGSQQNIGSVNIAFYNGNVRTSTFDLEVSDDAGTWSSAGTFTSSGTTLNVEAFDITDQTARYIRYVGHGNSVNAWNSITEFEITSGLVDTEPPTAPSSLSASNSTQTSIDLSWNASTDNVGVTGYDVYKNGSLETSTSSASVTISGLSCGNSYSFYVKAKDEAGNISASSNTINPSTANCPSNNCESPANIAIGKAASASSNDGNVPANTVDDNTTTRWSAQYYPQWLEIDLGANGIVEGIEIDPYSNRGYQFKIEAKIEGGSYSTIVDKTSSLPGNTSLFTESFDETDARYVKLTITGCDGSNCSSQEWASVEEFRILGCDGEQNNFAFEAGTISNSQGSSADWYMVNFTNTYTSPIVVMGPPSFNGADPEVMRVKNVGSASFQYQQDEWDYRDGGHTTEDIGYMVAEEGNSTIGGLAIEAGSISGVNDGFTLVSFNQGFSTTPVVVAQVVTVNEGSAVTTRIQNVSTTGFEIKLQEEEAGGSHANETVHYIAIEKGSGSEGGIDVLVDNTGNSVTEAWFAESFSTSITSPVFIAEMQTYDGGDPCAIRMKSLSSTGVQVFAEEEASADTEIGHTSEDVGYIVIESGSVTRSAMVQTSIASTGMPNDVFVYPNPTTGKLNVKSNANALSTLDPNIITTGKLNVKSNGKMAYVTNIMGQLVRQVKLKNGSAQLDLSNQIKGMYFIRVNNTVKSIVLK